MTKRLCLGMAIGVSFFCVAAAQSMPLAPLEQAGLTIPVAGGCGPGFHRGPYGGCRRNGYYGGAYYGAPGVAVAPGVVVTAPGVAVGPRIVGPSCRRCNAYRCWYVC